MTDLDIKKPETSMYLVMENQSDHQISIRALYGQIGEGI